MLTILGLILVAIVIWLWQSGMRAKECAVKEAKALCKEASVQLLDATVSLEQWKFERTLDGPMAFKRTYSFEYTDNESARYRGRVVIHAGQLADSSLKFKEGLSTENHSRFRTQKAQDEQEEFGRVIKMTQFQKPKNDENP